MAIENILPEIINDLTGENDIDFLFEGEPIITLTNEVYGQILLADMIY